MNDIDKKNKERWQKELFQKQESQILLDFYNALRNILQVSDNIINCVTHKSYYETKKSLDSYKMKLISFDDYCFQIAPYIKNKPYLKVINENVLKRFSYLLRILLVMLNDKIQNNLEQIAMLKYGKYWRKKMNNEDQIFISFADFEDFKLCLDKVDELKKQQENLKKYIEKLELECIIPAKF